MKKLITLILFVFLAGCSFTPLFTEQNQQDVLKQTAYIRIDPISDIDGVKLKELLSARLKTDQQQEKKYKLKITLTEKTIGDVSIQTTSFSSRSRLILTADYQLIDIKTKQILDSGSTNIGQSYNLTTPYSTYIAKKKAKDNLIKVLSDNISLKLFSYFKQQGATVEG